MVDDVADGHVVADLKHHSTARCLPAVFMMESSEFGEPQIGRSSVGRKVKSTARQIEAIAISKDNILAAGGDEGMVYLFKFSAPAEKPPIRQTGSDLICIEGEDFDASLSQERPSKAWID